MTLNTYIKLFLISFTLLVSGIDPKDLTTRSSCAGGAMALLCGKCDTDTIKLFDLLHSNAMMFF